MARDFKITPTVNGVEVALATQLVSLRRFRSGLYYAPSIATALSTGNLGQNFLAAVPFEVGQTTTFIRIGCDVTVAVASSTLRFGIYTADIDDSGGAPGTLILDAGTVSSATTGLKEITISQQLTPGLYWVAVVAQAGASAPTIRTMTSGSPYVSSTSGVANNLWSKLSVSGALPNPFGTATGGSGGPYIVMKTA